MKPIKDKRQDKLEELYESFIELQKSLEEGESELPEAQDPITRWQLHNTLMEEVEEDSDEVNEHRDGEPGYNQEPRVRSQGCREKHPLPEHLVNVTSKNWFGTHNDPEYLDEDELRYVLDANRDLVEYFVMFKEEAPTTGKEHYHSLVVLNKIKRAHVCINIDPRGVWEKCRTNALSCYKYISKDGQRYFEFGTRPANIQRFIENSSEETRKRRMEKSKNDGKFREMVQRAKVHDMSITDEMLYARFRQYFDDLLAKSFTAEVYQGDLKFKNLWIQGPPGIGKSRLVWDFARDFGLRVYPKNQNKWFDGYNGQEIILIDDACPDQMKYIVEKLKVWSDRYSFMAEIKGSSRMINCKDFYLIVTSNYRLEYCFSDVDGRAIERRFDVLDLFQ